MAVVSGDLYNPESYRASLRGVGCVIHLAALTGRGSEREFERSNVEGTRALLSACAAEGVARFVYVSTIAAAYPELESYPYARTKRDAEDVVRDSSLAWTILRPTVVLGAGSAVFAKLRSLAAAPVMVVPGKGEVMTQPVHVDDLARLMVAVAVEGLGRGETIDVGGPERSSMFGLLRAIRAQVRGGGDAVIRVPLAPMVFAARASSRILGAMAPVGPGQLSAFRFPSVAAAHPVTDALNGGFASIPEMIRLSIRTSSVLNLRNGSRGHAR